MSARALQRISFLCEYSEAVRAFFAVATSCAISLLAFILICAPLGLQHPLDFPGAGNYLFHLHFGMGFCGRSPIRSNGGLKTITAISKPPAGFLERSCIRRRDIPFSVEPYLNSDRLSPDDPAS